MKLFSAHLKLFLFKTMLYQNENKMITDNSKVLNNSYQSLLVDPTIQTQEDEDREGRKLWYYKPQLLYIQTYVAVI